MPVAFTRLRIAGFKSFAEPQIVEILPGLTGVVGPNGCGKSNVVEALRWAMGETSARSLRGGEMDDVIFAGSAGRPSRNLAEVVVTLEEALGTASPPFHDAPELQISRKIERGAGSVFRVNGREARARDVQTLFADLASGARSSAMVSQGRVAAIINARPDERRAVLEEAAGITGLHARRHEAELKLRAAEANLERAEDLRAQLDSQLAALQKQARQANRWQTLSVSVKQAEAELLAIARARAEAQRVAAAAAIVAARALLAAAGQDAAAAARAEAQTSAALPPMREAEASSRATLERLRIKREQMAAEVARARDALATAAARQAQVARDLAHAERAKAEADAAATRLHAEQHRLQEAEADAPERMVAVETELAAAQEAAKAAEAAANQATERAAELTATSQAMIQALGQAEQRSSRLSGQLAQLRADRARANAAQVDADKLAELAATAKHAAAQVEAARQAQETAEQARVAAAAATSSARQRESADAAALAKLTVQTTALAEVLGVKDAERWPPMVDALTVPTGLEAALGAALGEELGAAADPVAARHWRELPPLASLPLPAAALSVVVCGPPTLQRALAGIGLVESEAEGDAKQPTLLAGQALVSRDGAVWRWDGYTVRAGTPTAAAIRLQQRNRLDMLRVEQAAAAEIAARSAAERAAADMADRDAIAADIAARAGRREAEARAARLQAENTRLATIARDAAAKIAALEEQSGRLVPEVEEASAASATLQAERAKLPDLTMLRAGVERARATLAAARAREAAVQIVHRDAQRETVTRTARLRTLAAELANQTLRASEAASRETDLRARAVDAAAERAALDDAPAAIAGQAEEAAAAFAAAEAEQRRAASTVEAASRASSQAAAAARVAESNLGLAREGVLRAEAAAIQANHAWGTVAERVLERLGAQAMLPQAPADVSEAAEERARRKLDRLAREREEMGPVNLRAALEASEIEARIAGMESEKVELNTAIAKLRGSIGHINRGGRERLAEIFAQVDRHFQALFGRMFGGGRAHLGLVGSEDPLQAGLEIYAQPPGKKLATLSLLSGGEQALTALSLIFAMFRCNPAPICVLDEVDAPLDDANVERFCALLGEMVRETGTRFLVVTHHHLTMARMDRLYGVTMQERGVSRLLSVDLARAAAMVEQRAAAE